MLSDDNYYDRQQELWDVTRGVTAAESVLSGLLDDMGSTSYILDPKLIENGILRAQVRLMQLEKEVEFARSDLQIDDLMDSLMHAETEIGELRAKVRTVEQALDDVSEAWIDPNSVLDQDWPDDLLFGHGDRVFDTLTKLTGWIVSWEDDQYINKVVYVYETASGMRVDAPEDDLIIDTFDEGDSPVELKFEHEEVDPFAVFDQETLELERAGYLGTAWNGVHPDLEDDEDDEWIDRQRKAVGATDLAADTDKPEFRFGGYTDWWDEEDGDDFDVPKD